MELTIFKIAVKYYYKEPNVGTISTAGLSVLGLLGAQAIVHTHAAYDTRYSSDIFSQGDKDAATALNMPIYVATPIGTLRKFDPYTGDDVIISIDIPFDPKHPGRNGD